jgi:hypothetical protein
MSKNNINFEETFLKYFNEIDDSRRSYGNKKHFAAEILLLTLCAIISGVDSWWDFVEYGQSKLNFLRKFFPYESGLPSKNTFYRFFAALKPELFKACFNEWVKSLKLVDNEVIAIDGKTLRRSFDKTKEQKSIHMVSAFATNSGIVLGQERVAEKYNEITAIPKLLDVLDIKDCIVTIDAMGTQKKIAEQIINGGWRLHIGIEG